MATFDSSALANIPAETDPSRGIMQGLQLSDLMTDREAKELGMQEQRQNLAARSALSKIMQGTDWNNSDSVAQSFQRASKAGLGPQALPLMKQFQDLQNGKTAQQAAQAKLQVDQNNLTDHVMDQIASNASDILQIQRANRDPAQGFTQAKAEFLARLPGFLQSLPANLPSTPQVRQGLVVFAQKVQANQVTPAQFDQALNSEINGSAQGRAHLAQQNSALIAQHRLDLDTSSAAERKRHDLAEEKNAAQGRYGIKAPQTSAGQDLLDQVTGATGGKGITLATLRGTNWDDLAKNGVTAQQFIQSGFKYTGTARAATAIGQRQGTVAVLEGSFGGAADQVRSALQGVSRGNITSVNRAIAAGKTSFGDPGESRYAAAIQTAVNEYSRVVGGGVGATTDSARADANRLLSAAQSPAQVDAVLKQMSREVSIVKGAAGSAMAGVGAGTGATPSAPAAPATAPAARQLPPKNAQGWALMRDAQGNQAYVSPDGKQFQAAQ